MSLFLYASGSPFEDVLNGYMISGRGVNPFNPRGGLGAGGNGNGSVGVGGVRELSGAVVSGAVEGKGKGKGL